MATQPEGSDGWIPEDSFGARLVLIRHQLGLTQEAAAEKCNLTRATWATWEHGTRPQDRELVVRKIVRATGVNGHWLMWGTSQSACLSVTEPLLGQGDLFDAAQPPPELEVIVTSAAG